MRTVWGNVMTFFIFFFTFQQSFKVRMLVCKGVHCPVCLWLRGREAARVIGVKMVRILSCLGTGCYELGESFQKMLKIL